MEPTGQNQTYPQPQPPFSSPPVLESNQDQVATSQPPVFDKKRHYMLVGLITLLIVIGLGLAAAYYYLRVSSTPTPVSFPPATPATVLKPTSTPASITQEVHLPGDVEPGQIVYSSLGQVFLFDTATATSQQLPINDFEAVLPEDRDGGKRPDSLTFTHDGQHLFISYGLMNLYLFDFETNQLVWKKTLGPNAGTSPRLISSNDQYLLVDTGTAPPPRGITLLNLQGDQLFQISGFRVQWIPNQSAFVYEKPEISFPNFIVDPCPSAYSLSLVSIDNNQVVEKPLLIGTNQVSYSLFEVIDDRTILIQKDTYSQPIETIPDNEKINDSKYQEKWNTILFDPKIEYFDYDLDTSLLVPVAKPAEQKPDFGTSYSPSRNWKTYVSGQWPDKQVMISRADGTDAAVIAPGDDAVWRP